MENGEWRMENGEWRMENEIRTCKVFFLPRRGYPLGLRIQTTNIRGWLVETPAKATANGESNSEMQGIFLPRRGYLFVENIVMTYLCPVGATLLVLEFKPQILGVSWWRHQPRRPRIANSERNSDVQFARYIKGFYALS